MQAVIHGEEDPHSCDSRNTLGPRKKNENPIGDGEVKGSSSSTHRKQEVGGSMRRSFVALTDGDCGPLDPTHYSSWLKLRRIRAWVNRFVQDCKKKPAARIIGELIADELKRAEVQLIKQAQRHQFPEEWKALTSARSVPSSSKLISLNPTLDDVGVIRSDGRLKKVFVL